MSGQAKIAPVAGHRVQPKDRPRIRCQHGSVSPDCTAEATVCEHLHWDTGQRAGVSFFYFCDDHAPPALRAALEAACS